MIIIYTLTFFIIFLTYFLLIRKQQKLKLDSNKTVLITGGCMGIGKQMCKLLAMKKCKIIVLDIRKDLAADLKNTIEQYGSTLQFYECDLSNQEQIIETINQINEPIHILINNAGVAKLKLFTEQSFQDLQLTHAVNYLAPVLLSKLLIPKMEAQKFGHIVNVGSVLSIITGLKVTAYCASKHALLGFHNSLRVELKLKKSPIKCTFIAPWAINTGMFKGVKSKIDFLLPELKEERVAIEIIDAIENQKDVHSIPSFYWLLRLIWGDLVIQVLNLHYFLQNLTIQQQIDILINYIKFNQILTSPSRRLYCSKGIGSLHIRNGWQKLMINIYKIQKQKML